MLKKIQPLFNLASAVHTVAATVQWLKESLQQLKVWIKDAPLSHSNGATIVMRTAWYEKVLTCRCMHACLQACEHFKKLRTGGSLRRKTVQHTVYLRPCEHCTHSVYRCSQFTFSSALFDTDEQCSRFLHIMHKKSCG